MDPKLQKIYNSVLEGDGQQASQGVQEALSAQIDPGVILAEGMIAAMREVGSLYEQGEFFVPEMLIAARAMQAGMAVLKPHLVGSGIKAAGKVVIGTVQGDMHDIGKNLVALMLEGAGFEIKDLGTDVPPERFVEAVQTEEPDIIGLSALLTTTMPNMEDVIKALNEAGLRQQVKVIIGGAPVTEEYAQSIGADGFAPDASRAVSLASSLVAG